MKGRRDLLSAKKLAQGREPYLDTAIYHCQQTAEKIIKGWLVYHDLSFEKTHDLRLLVTMASEIEPRFTAWFDVAEQVSHMQPPIGILGKYWNQQRRIPSSFQGGQRILSICMFALAC